MNTSTDEFLVKAGGMILFIAALLLIPALFLSFTSIVSGPFFIEKLTGNGMQSPMVTGKTVNFRLFLPFSVIAISILLFLRLSYWVFGYPKLLRKFFHRFPNNE